MALSEDTSDSLLWDVSVTGKSWVELAEEEDEDFARLNKSGMCGVSCVSPSGKGIEIKCKDEPIKQEPKDEESPKCRIDNSSEEPLKHFSLTYAKIVKSPSVNGTEKESVKEEIVDVMKTEFKREIQKDFLQDELSLTGHLNEFQLVSPCKVEKNGQPRLLKELRNNDSRDIEEKVSTDVKVPKRKIIEDNRKEGNLSDDVLMPSPSKISRPNTTPLFDKETFIRRKRVRENSHGSTPSRGGSGRKKPLELETDPEVLARRQKQIDYGKNTIGYDRYRHLVPKESRKSVHPRTPPMHLKYSRRAWDGLVKIWRQRLHFWDPPSEGGGNPECLEISSDLSDLSSTDGSQPNTPVQEWKRRARTRRDDSNKGPEETEEEFMQGCTPLPE